MTPIYGIVVAIDIEEKPWFRRKPHTPTQGRIAFEMLFVPCSVTPL